MCASLKTIVAFFLALQIALVSAFVTPGGVVPATRSIHHAPVLTGLYMATATPTRETDTKDKTQQQNDKQWAVRLYNDPMNKREYVARCLTEICGLNDGTAYSVMMHAHQQGLAVVGKYEKEIAETYKSSLTTHGLTVDMVEA